MDLIYPKLQARIYLPVQLDGSEGKTVFEVAHRRPGATIYWHLDGQFITSTSTLHRLTVTPLKGKHFLTLVDDKGETLMRSFEVISR
jgi:penicillin-binding protein 1C